MKCVKHTLKIEYWLGLTITFEYVVVNMCVCVVGVSETENEPISFLARRLSH